MATTETDVSARLEVTSGLHLESPAALTGGEPSASSSPNTHWIPARKCTTPPGASSCGPCAQRSVKCAALAKHARPADRVLAVLAPVLQLHLVAVQCDQDPPIRRQG